MDLDPPISPKAAAALSLRLLAFDPDDLAVLSAHLQDAEVQGSDIAWLAREGRFAMVARRFDWLLAEQGRYERRECGVHFDHVRKVARLGFGADAAPGGLRLLSVQFAPAQAPSGHVLLLFSDARAIRLEVECLEASLRDMEGRWPAPAPKEESHAG